MNATDQTELERIEKRIDVGDISAFDARYLLNQLLAAQDEIGTLKAEVERLKGDKWMPIESMPKEMIFIRLATGPDDDKTTGEGIYWEGKFYMTAVFYHLGKEKPYAFREIEVQPTHWQPLPEPPKI